MSNGRHTFLWIIALIFFGTGLLRAEAAWEFSLPKGSVSVVEVVGADGFHYYHSEHFEIRSDRRLSARWSMEIALAAETSKALHEKMFEAYRLYGDLGTPARRVIYIFSAADNFSKAGAPEGTRGFFDGSTVYVTYQSLRRSRGLNGSVGNLFGPMSTLIHEVAHLSNREAFGTLPVWLDESIATYFEGLTYRSGTFQIDASRALRHAQTIERSGRAMEKSALLRLTPRTWHRELATATDGNEALVSAAYQFGVSLFHGESKAWLPDLLNSGQQSARLMLAGR